MNKRPRFMSRARFGIGSGFVLVMYAAVCLLMLPPNKPETPIETAYDVSLARIVHYDSLTLTGTAQDDDGLTVPDTATQIAPDPTAVKPAASVQVQPVPPAVRAMPYHHCAWKEASQVW